MRVRERNEKRKSVIGCERRCDIHSGLVRWSRHRRDAYAITAIVFVLQGVICSARVGSVIQPGAEPG